MDNNNSDIPIHNLVCACLMTMNGGILFYTYLILNLQMILAADI